MAGVKPNSEAMGVMFWPVGWQWRGGRTIGVWGRPQIRFRVLQLVEERRLVRRRRRDAAAAGRCETELGRNAHHDLGLTVGNGKIGGLDRETGRRLDHRSVFLDLRGGLGPQRIGTAVGGHRGTIEIGQKA
jgi:hypothetical protein